MKTLGDTALSLSKVLVAYKMYVYVQRNDCVHACGCPCLYCVEHDSIFLDANTSFTPQSTHNLIKGLMLSNKEMHVPGWESK
jgi:hypothetical protein